MRYDIEFPPQLAAPDPLALTAYNALGLQKGIQTDTNNVQPRVGFAWDPKGNGKSVLRGSYGIFYDHPLLGTLFPGRCVGRIEEWAVAVCRRQSVRRERSE